MSCLCGEVRAAYFRLNIVRDWCGSSADRNILSKLYQSPTLACTLGVPEGLSTSRLACLLASLQPAGVATAGLPAAAVVVWAVASSPSNTKLSRYRILAFMEATWSFRTGTCMRRCEFQTSHTTPPLS